MSKSHHLGPRYFLPSNPLRLKPIVSYSSAPTHEEVSNLILQQKSASQALATFRWAARFPSFVHHPSTYHALVRSLLSFRRLDAAFEALHEIPSATGSPPDEATLVALLRALGRARRPRDALHLLDLLPSRFGVSEPSLRIFNSVLDVLVREDIDAARDFFRERMMGRGIRGDEHTFGILMKGLCRTNRIAEGFKLLQLMKRSGLRPNAVTYNTLIHALCRNGKVGRARSLMNEMESPSGVTFNILITAYCGEGNVVQALVMLEKCFQLGLVPDAITATKIVGVLCSQGRVMEAAEIVERVERKGGVRDVVSYNTLIKGFCGMNKPEVGRRVLKEMECKGCLPNVHTYNALISGFCGSGKLDSAMDLFREMRTDGIHPDFETFDVLIRGLCSGGRVGDGLKVLDEMEEERAVHGIQINPYNSILYGLYKEDRVEESYEFLKNMSTTFPRAVDRSLAILRFCKEDEVGEGKLVYDQMVGEGGVPNVLVYACLIKGLCKEGNVRGAFLLMNDMVEKGFFPAAATFNALICAFCEEGNLSSASKLLQEMVRRGCNLNAGSYSPLISALCKQGDLTRAFGYLVQMVERDIAPDHSTWNSLLLCDSLWTKSGSKIAMNESLMQVVEV